MKINKWAIGSLTLLIVLLIAFNVKMTNLGEAVEYACTEDYSYYLETETCPCIPAKSNDLPQWALTNPNYSQSFNISLLEQ